VTEQERPCSGVVSLLDERHSTIVEQMWDELERELGVIDVRQIPWPHFSYQVGDYDTARINHALEGVAQTMSPFPVATAGLAAFTGAQPILYVRLFEPRSCRSDNNACGTPLATRARGHSTTTIPRTGYLM
jgi:hypothetical protein